MELTGYSRNGYAVSLNRYDFLERIKPDQPEIESLIHCGALEGLGHSRPAMFSDILSWYRKGRNTGGGDQAALDLEETCSTCLTPERSESDNIVADIETLSLSPLPTLWPFWIGRK